MPDAASAHRKVSAECDPVRSPGSIMAEHLGPIPLVADQARVVVEVAMVEAEGESN